MNKLKTALLLLGVLSFEGCLGNTAVQGDIWDRKLSPHHLKGNLPDCECAGGNSTSCFLYLTDFIASSGSRPSTYFDENCGTTSSGNAGMMLSTAVTEILKLVPPSFDWKSYIKTNLLQHHSRRSFQFDLFLYKLFDELLAEDVQVADSREMRPWWAQQNGSVELVRSRLITQGFQSPYIFNNDNQFLEAVNDTEAAERLKKLLDLTLQIPTCPNEGEETVFIGNTLSLSFVHDCITNFTQNPQTVILMARHSVFFDRGFNGSGVNPNKTSNLVVLTPIWEIQRPFIFLNLNGHNGKDGEQLGEHGESGGDGGFLFGLQLIAKNNSLLFSSDGGNGGKGRDGRNGSAGTDAAPVNFRASLTSHCEAGYGGKIQVKVLPNNCSSGCHAGDNGVNVTIIGSDGSRGGDGGNGGNGGGSGSGGNLFIINLDRADPVNETGRTGVKGQGGKGGEGGLGGLHAQNLKVRVDDMWSGIVDKVCEELGRWLQGDRGRAASGSRGQDGVVRRSKELNINQNLDAFRMDDYDYARYGNMYTEVLDSTTDEYFGPLCALTASKIRAHPGVPK